MESIMNRILLIIMIIGLMLPLCAQGTDPIERYLEFPGVDNFLEAVTALNDSLNADSDPWTIKANLAYIANSEANRLLDELRANEEHLSAGQRFMVANMLLGMDKYDLAIELYEGLNKDYPKWSCPWRHRGEALYKLGDYKTAVTALNQAIKTNPQHYDAYVWLALTQKELKLYKDAMANLDEARKLDPNAEGGADDVMSAESVDALYKELQMKAKKGRK